MLATFSLTALAHHQCLAQPAQPAPTTADAAGAPFEDPSFDQALPSLDQPATQATVPAVAPVDASSTPQISTAPAADEDDAMRNDAELAAPLTPLQSFEQAEPLAVDVPTGEKPRTIRYRLTVEGLKAIDLDDRFKDLSALAEGNGKADNGVQLSARADEDVKLAERLLRSEGYYDGHVDVTVTPAARPDDPTQVALTATPGVRYTLNEIRVTGPDTQPPGLAVEALGLTRGEPIEAVLIEAAEADVQLRLPRYGYPFAKIGARDILLDEATHEGDYTLPVEPGPRSSFGGFRTSGSKVFDTDHLEVLSRFDRGELYDSRKTDDLKQALIATNLFSAVSVEPVDTGEKAADGTEIVDMLVRQGKGRQRSIAVTGGYGTGEGFKLEGSWTHRNLFPPEGALIVSAVAGTQQQSFGTTFRRSNAGKRDRTFQFGAQVSHEDRDAFSARSFSLSGSLSRDSTPIWQKHWTYSIGTELIATDESRFNEDRAERTRSTYFIAALPLQLGYDGSDSLLDPTRGFRVTGRISPEASLKSGVHSYVRTLLETSGYLPLADGLVLAGRTRLGSIQGIGRDSIAPSRRLYAGGGGSVRGYGYQELGPKDANGDPLGGRSLTEFAVEARYRFGNYGIVPFLDAGQLYQSTLPKFSGLRYGAGIGARYYTNFGPLRLDVATPINRRPGESKITLYISIGQAF